jgi:hypothetical protein
VYVNPSSKANLLLDPNQHACVPKAFLSCATNLTANSDLFEQQLASKPSVVNRLFTLLRASACFPALTKESSYFQTVCNLLCNLTHTSQTDTALHAANCHVIQANLPRISTVVKKVYKHCAMQCLSDLCELTQKPRLHLASCTGSSKLSSRVWCDVLEYLLKERKCTKNFLNVNEDRDEVDLLRSLCRSFWVAPDYPERMLQLLAEVLLRLNVADCEPTTSSNTAHYWNVCDVACVAVKAITACLTKLTQTTAITPASETVQCVSSISTWLQQLQESSKAPKPYLASEIAGALDAIACFQQATQSLTQALKQVTDLQQQVAALQHQVAELQQVRRTAEDQQQQVQLIVMQLRSLLDATALKR